MLKTSFQSTTKQFFKPILPGSFKELSIPNGFIKYLDAEKCEGGEAILKINNSENSWRVKVNGFRFQQGWNDFARDNDLHVKDLLVFRHEGGMVFNVTVFDASACEREYPPLDFTTDHRLMVKEAGSVKDSQSAIIVGDGAQPTLKHRRATRFTVTLKRYNFTQQSMHVPQPFARSNGLLGRCCTIVLKDSKGRSWDVNLRAKKTDSRTLIRGGWRQFSDGNKLKEGDVCTFKIISTGLKPIMKVTISRC